MTRCRLIVDGPADGVWNMAVDEALLARDDPGDDCVLRFYRWAAPTLSLGYFQPFADCERRWLQSGCAIVRRTSGGGAILHDAELTYALVVGRKHPLSTRPDALYSAVHGALVRALAALGTPGAQIHAPHGADVVGIGDVHPPPASADFAGNGEPFLCFRRRAPCDVVLHGAKIAGSAQRRRRNAILQHGSVLLATSPAAAELQGIAELSGIADGMKCPIRAACLVERWTSELTAGFGFRFEPSTLTEHESAMAAVLARDKFGSEAWTKRR